VRNLWDNEWLSNLAHASLCQHADVNGSGLLNKGDGWRGNEAGNLICKLKIELRVPKTSNNKIDDMSMSSQRPYWETPVRL
jgi:hypothetical protein